MNEKLVSIIIRTKNEEKWISGCLRSVFRQSYKNIEVIIVDNESTDRTVIKAKEFPVKVITIQEFFPGKAINDGIRASTGDYVVCLSGHCIPVLDTWLATLVKEVSNPNVAGIYGRQEPLSFTSDLDKRDLLTVFGLDKKVQIKDSFFHNANSAFSRKIWEKYPFDENLTNIEDRVWGEQVISAGFNIIYEPDASVYHWHGIHQDLNADRAKNIVRILESLDTIKANAIYENLEDLKILSVIPVKGESKLIDDKPMMYYSIESAKQSKFITDIIVSTDNENTSELAKSMGAESPFIRPSSLSEDYIDIFQVIEYTLSQLEQQSRHYDIIVLLEEVYPFREDGLIDKMISELIIEGSDTVIAGVAENRGIWTSDIDSGKFSNLFEATSMPSALKDSKTMISLLGLCCVTHSASLHQNMVLSGNVGIVEISNPLSLITAKNERELLLANLVAKNK